MLPATSPPSAKQLTHPPPFLYYYKCLMGCKPKREFWYSFYHSSCLAGESDRNRKSSLVNRNMIYHTVFTTLWAFGCVRQKPKLIHHKPKHALLDCFYHSSGCVYWSETNRNMSTANRNMYYHTVFAHICSCTRNRNSSTTNRNMLYHTVSTNHLAVCIGQKQTETCPQQTETCIVIQFLPYICSCTRNRNSSTANRNHISGVVFCVRGYACIPMCIYTSL